MKAFISGHRDLTQEEFDLYYIPLIDAALDSGDTFIIGDCRGADTMAQKYLNDIRVEYENSLVYLEIIVYHMFTHPRNNVCRAHTKGGYTSDEERDAAMTNDSDYDIAWVRSGREKSGTAINLKRRLKKINKL